MRRDADERRLRRRGDLARLPDAAAVGEIRLQHVGRAEREDVAESPFGEEPLTGRHRDRDRRRDLGHRRAGPPAAPAPRRRRCRTRPAPAAIWIAAVGERRPWQSIRTSTSGPTASRISRICRRACAQLRLPGDARHGLERAELERAPSCLDQANARLGDLLRRLAARAVGVEPHPVAHPAAEQLVDRDAERLAEDVPQRLLDAGDGAADDDPAAPERVAVDGLPVVLDPRRILPDQVLRDVVDGADDRLGLALQAGLADAGDAGVGAAPRRRSDWCGRRRGRAG